MTDRTAPICGCVTTGKIVRGMCAKHYDRWVHKTPKDLRPPAPRSIRRFWDHVDKSGDCWLWLGPTNRKGYGTWSEPGFKGLAHRYSLMQVCPPFDSASACHHCDKSALCEPGTPLLGHRGGQRPRQIGAQPRSQQGRLLRAVP